MPTPRATVNQQTQIAVETTPGTFVPANKYIGAFTWTIGMKAATKQFRGTGRQYPGSSAVLTEMSSGKITGPFDFSQVAYPLSSHFGSGSPVPHGGATTAYDSTWTPPLVGSYAGSAKTYTVEQGDVNDAERYAFLVFNGFGYEINRQQEMTFDSDFIAQTLTDAITMTASPTVVSQVPSTGAQYSIYLDNANTGLGVTQLTDPLKVTFKADPFYEPYWPINRSNSSYTNIVDKEKKFMLTLALQANTSAVAFKGSYLETGARCYVRVDGVGQLIENNQTVGVGAASAGNFTLTYKGQTTGNIAYNALNSAVQTAITGLSTVGAGNAVVTGTAPTWTVRFTGTLANDTTLMTGSGAGLTGGALTITAAPVNAAFRHDMACFVADMTPFADEGQVYKVEYKLQVAEDTAWNTGQAQKITTTALLSAL